MPHAPSTAARRRRRVPALLAAAVVAAGAVFVVSPTAAFADGLGEFEQGYIYPEANGDFPADPAASGGAAAEMWDASSNDLSVDNSTATVAYRIRARQVQCGPAAVQMVVKVDSVTVGTFNVTATTYTNYSVTGNWAAGWHLIHVDFVNPYFGSCGARELFLDDVVAVSPTSTTYYVDGVAGSDGNAGTSTAAPWKTIAKVNAATFAPGDTVLFKRGQTFSSAALVADNAGTSAARVTYGAYGTGAAPVFDGGYSSYPISITAAYVTVQDVTVQHGGQSDQIGLAVWGTDALVQRVTATGNAIGVEAENGADRLRVTASSLINNTTVISPSGSDDDYGANGVVVLHADTVEVDHNTISGNVGTSPDFGYDGSAVEVYGGIGTTVDHNVAADNQTFSELGDTRTDNTTYYDNLVTTSSSDSRLTTAIGINAQGTGTFGPVLDTKIYNNTFVLKGSSTQGIIVDTNATASLHNNIVQASYIGWTAQKIDEGNNVYYGGTYGNDIDSTANAGTGVASTSTTANPLFASGTDYHLQSGSPAKNRGTSNYSITTDLDGNPRTYGSGTDSGAYERQSS